MIIDCRHAETGSGDSFPALEKHEFVDPLEAPGMGNLTAHVNFPLLAHIAQTHGLRLLPLPNRVVLKPWIEYARTTAHAGQSEHEQINTERLRLAAPQHMGELLKCWQSHMPICLCWQGGIMKLRPSRRPTVR